VTPATPTHELVRLHIAAEADVFTARQRGRTVAAVVGLDNASQVRVATALSELCRELAGDGRPATVALGVQGGTPPRLVITATWSSTRAGADLNGTDGLAAAARLMDTCEVTTRAGKGEAVLTRRLRGFTEPLTAERVDALRTECRTASFGSALEALRIQNQDLLSALEELQARQEDLVRANAELEETNRGVLALHAELSEELEQTNQGVVALYAELDEATRQLQAASESKTRFWAGVSHELRTPLNSVLGLSRLLLDADSDALTTEQRHQIELIRDSGSTLLTLVNDLLDVARAEAGQIEVRFQLVDVVPLLQRLCAAVRPMAAADVELVVDVPESGLVLRSDPALVERVVLNLLGNAVKFTQHGSVRAAAAAADSHDVEIVVSDTGIGIPREHRERVFEEFYQVPGPLQRPRAGTGLGLSYARRVATVLGGSLALESEPGSGTTVVVRLPTALGTDGPERYDDVLVVEDDPAFRKIAHSALEPFTQRITDAGSGAEALHLMAARRPDLVMLDLNIPAPDGRDVLGQMRGALGLGHVPVVVVTSAQLTAADHADLSTSAVVLDKSRFSAALLPHVVADAARLAGRRP
jgi:signal transduction histidine kinase/CheY-like chemotaxis protein